MRWLWRRHPWRRQPALLDHPQRTADGTVVAVTALPVGDDLAAGGAVRHRALLARLAGRHVVQHVLHRLTVRQRTLQRNGGAGQHMANCTCSGGAQVVLLFRSYGRRMTIEVYAP